MTDYDALIIGAGTTGAVIAYELGRRGFRVLVVEAGGLAGFKKPLPIVGDGGVTVNHAFKLPGTDLGSAYSHSRFGLGGSGQIYAGWTYRFHPNDFKLKSTYGVGEDWPLSYKELAPYYARTEQLMGVAGEPDHHVPGMTDAYPMEAFPIDYASQVFNRISAGILTFTPAPQSRNRIPYDGRPACAGFKSCWVQCPIEAKWTPQNSVIYKSNDLNKIDYLIRSPVFFIEAAPGGLITSIRCQTLTGELKLSAKKYVLAANGIETPRILLHSKQPSAPQGLANSSGLVGKNYTGHPDAKWEIDLGEHVFGGRGPLHSSHCTRFCDHPERAAAAAFNIHHLQSFLPAIEIDDDLWGSAMIRKAQNDCDTRVKLIISYEMLPDPRNFIDLDTDVDNLGIPYVNIHYRLTEYCKRGIDLSARVIRQILKNAGLKDFDQSAPTADGGHWMGATKMGFNRSGSVTDSYGRSWDHPNLFIAGASLYPTPTVFNPIETSVALALRTADKIAAVLGAQS